MIKNIVIPSLMLLAILGCNPSKPRASDTINIEFLIGLFQNDRLGKDKILLDNGFSIGYVDHVNTPVGEMRYEGYLKGYNIADEKFEFIHYTTDGNYWLEYMTRKSKTTSSILESIQSNPDLKKIAEGVFQDKENTIVIERKTIILTSVYSVKIYENSFFKTLD